MSAQEVFDAVAAAIASDPNTVKVVNGIFHFKIDGKSWTIDLKNAPGSVKSGAPEKADVTITIAEGDFVNLMTGKTKGQQLFMGGKLKIQGNMGLAMKLDKIPKKKPEGTAASAPAPAPAKAAPAPASGSKLKSAAVFDELAKKIAATPDLIKQIGGVYQFDIAGESWAVDLKNGKGSVAAGKPAKADVTITVGDDEFVGMMTGKLNSQQLFMQGKLKIKGNMGLAMKLNKLQAPKAAL